MDPREQFGREAEKYLTSKSHANAEELNRLVQLVGPKGGRILDIATGSGHVAFAFSPLVDHVTATDITPEMLEIVKRESAIRGMNNIETAIASAEDLPFAEDFFDGVTCRVAAHHFRSPTAFVNEVHRVLKPQGWFLLVDTIGIENNSVADDTLNKFEAIRDPSHFRDYTVSQWTDWLISGGFAVIHCETNSHYHELEEWMNRMSVAEPSRSELRQIVEQSRGCLREYFEPKNESFRLHQVTLLAKKIG